MADTSSSPEEVVVVIDGDFGFQKAPMTNRRGRFRNREHGICGAATAERWMHADHM